MSGQEPTNDNTTPSSALAWFINLLRTGGAGACKTSGGSGNWVTAGSTTTPGTLGNMSFRFEGLQGSGGANNPFIWLESATTTPGGGRKTDKDLKKANHFHITNHFSAHASGAHWPHGTQNKVKQISIWYCSDPSKFNVNNDEAKFFTILTAQDLERASKGIRSDDKQGWSNEEKQLFSCLLEYWESEIIKHIDTDKSSRNYVLKLFEDVIRGEKKLNVDWNEPNSFFRRIVLAARKKQLDPQVESLKAGNFKSTIDEGAGGGSDGRAAMEQAYGLTRRIAPFNNVANNNDPTKRKEGEFFVGIVPGSRARQGYVVSFPDNFSKNTVWKEELQRRNWGNNHDLMHNPHTLAAASSLLSERLGNNDTSSWEGRERPIKKTLTKKQRKDLEKQAKRKKKEMKKKKKDVSTGGESKAMAQQQLINEERLKLNRSIFAGHKPDFNKWDINLEERLSLLTPNAFIDGYKKRVEKRHSAFQNLAKRRRKLAEKMQTGNWEKKYSNAISAKISAEKEYDADKNNEKKKDSFLSSQNNEEKLKKIILKNFKKMGKRLINDVQKKHGLGLSQKTDNSSSVAVASPVAAPAVFNQQNAMEVLNNWWANNVGAGHIDDTVLIEGMERALMGVYPTLQQGMVGHIVDMFFLRKTGRPAPSRSVHGSGSGGGGGGGGHSGSGGGGGGGSLSTLRANAPAWTPRGGRRTRRYRRKQKKHTRKRRKVKHKKHTRHHKKRRPRHRTKRRH